MRIDQIAAYTYKLTGLDGEDRRQEHTNGENKTHLELESQLKHRIQPCSSTSRADAVIDRYKEIVP